MRNKKGQFAKEHIPWHAGKKVSPMSGKHHSKEAKRKISKANKGNPPTRTSFKKGHISLLKGKCLSEETKEKISVANKGRKLFEETKKKISKAHKGKHLSPTTEFKKGIVPWNKEKRCPDISERQTGNKNWQWKGGITPQIIALRRGWRIKRWRESIFRRDNYTCQLCGKRGYKLNAHHIIPFAEFPKFRWKIENGITLCKECHLGIKGKEFLYVPEFVLDSPGGKKYWHFKGENG